MGDSSAAATTTSEPPGRKSSKVSATVPQPGDKSLSRQRATFAQPSPVCTRPSTIPTRCELKTADATRARRNAMPELASTQHETRPSAQMNLLDRLAEAIGSLVAT